MARVVIPGVAHHVTQRGNRREKVFSRKADYQRYLALLAQYAGEHGLAIRAWCLMPNHVHLVAVPAEASSLSAVLRPVHLRYAQEANRRHGVTGVLWQGRFYSCPLDKDHYWAAVRYVERNPVRAGLVERAEAYAWSSAGGHCGLREDGLTCQGPWPEWMADLPPAECQARWMQWLREEDDPAMVGRLRLCTRTGRPAGTERFMARLERLAGRILRPGKPGRPKKRTKAAK
jgi:putative transposase